MIGKEKVYYFYSLARFFYNHHFEFISILIRIFMRLVFSCDIPYKAIIGKGTVFPHDALGVVIHEKSRIGENCHINQHVTIGGRSGYLELPNIGNNVLIGANAVIIGPVNIGNNVSIGAGSVVTKSFGDNLIIAGVPAKIIREKNYEENFDF